MLPPGLVSKITLQGDIVVSARVKSPPFPQAPEASAPPVCAARLLLIGSLLQSGACRWAPMRWCWAGGAHCRKGWERPPGAPMSAIGFQAGFLVSRVHTNCHASPTFCRASNGMKRCSSLIPILRKPCAELRKLRLRKGIGGRVRLGDDPHARFRSLARRMVRPVGAALWGGPARGRSRLCGMRQRC